MKKRILSLVLILCMITTLLPVHVKASGNTLTVGDNRQYSTVKAAYAAAQDGDTIQIYHQIIEDVALVITPEKTVTIEGKGSFVRIQGSSSTALTLSGKGTIILKNILLQGPIAHRSFGLFVAAESDIAVQSEGNVSANGGLASAMSVGVYNEMGSSFINIDYAAGEDAFESYGVVNDGSGTVNVRSAHGSSGDYSCGVVNYGSGIVNVNYAYYENSKANPLRATCLYNTGTGTINANRVGYRNNYLCPISVMNRNGGFVNIQEYDGALQGSNINTDVSELKLLKDDSASCLFESIIISNIHPTQIGKLPSPYIPTVKDSCGKWFLDEGKTLPAPTVIIAGKTTTLYGSYYNYTLPSSSLPLVSSIQSDRASVSANYTPGSDAITSKGFEWKKSSDSTHNVLALTTPELTAELNGLESNTHYEVRSFVKDSITHYSNAQDLLTLPSSPTLISVTPLNQSATLEWTNEGTSSYRIYQKESGDTNYQLVATVPDCEYTVSNLKNGITYHFLVKAVNASGESTNSGESLASGLIIVTPMTVPQAPTNLVATAGDAGATLSFTAPTDHGGSPIIGYIVTTNPGGIITASLSSPITITGLTNQTTYTFTVKSINALGVSLTSKSSNSVIPTTSQKPSSTPVASTTPAPSSSPTTSPTTSPTASPVTIQTDTDKNGDSSATVTNSILNQAINLSQKAPDKQSVQLKITSNASTKSIALIFKKASLNKLLSSKQKSFIMDTILADISLDMTAISSIIKQSGDPITIIISKLSTSSLSKLQKKATKQMPVYAVSITSKKKNLTSLSKGKLTISIPYKLKKGQTAKNITVYTLSSKGKRKAVSNCSYNSKTKIIHFKTSQVTTYCIGVK